eukprot:Skav229409  [mRNA]  locus=scaffold2297:72409:74851:+ [translate_table: standard]
MLTPRDKILRTTGTTWKIMAQAEKKEEPKPGDKRKDETPPEDSKRLKPTPPDPAVVRKQAPVEYYLSDENLKYDKFFHDKITENKEGWLEPWLAPVRSDSPQVVVIVVACCRGLAVVVGRPCRFDFDPPVQQDEDHARHQGEAMETTCGVTGVDLVLSISEKAPT